MNIIQVFLKRFEGKTRNLMLVNKHDYKVNSHGIKFCVTTLK